MAWDDDYDQPDAEKFIEGITNYIIPQTLAVGGAKEEEKK